MKTLIIWLLFAIVVFGQAPSEVLKSFDWPKEVGDKMKIISTYPRQTITLSKVQMFRQGYNVVKGSLYDNALLTEGRSLDLWRCEYDKESYFLATDGPGWYWTTTKPEIVYPCPDKNRDLETTVNIKTQYSYGNMHYAEHMDSSRYDIYAEKGFDFAGNSSDWVISPGVGLSAGYRPSLLGESTMTMIPMYQARLALTGETQLFQSELLNFQWYSVGSYYLPVDCPDDDFWELSSRLSWRLPHLNGFIPELNLTYYSSQPSSEDWEYGEGKIQILMSHESVPHLYVGIEPYVSADLYGRNDWVTYSKSNSGNVIFIISMESFWFEASYGKHHVKSGVQPLISNESDKEHLSFTIGTKVLRR